MVRYKRVKTNTEKFIDDKALVDWEEDKAFIDNNDLVDYSTQGAMSNSGPPDLTHKEDTAHSRAIAAQYSAHALILHYIPDDWNNEEEHLCMFLVASSVGIFRVKESLDQFIIQSICNLPNMYLAKFTVYHILLVLKPLNSPGMLYFETSEVTNMHLAINEV
ncbi:hypothetical protein HWV62_36035 [Athelia sp. TMB]|nr:hypothetical protein HWV62_36035 [Athelia sp. TMB]